MIYRHLGVEHGHVYITYYICQMISTSRVEISFADTSGEIGRYWLCYWLCCVASMVCTQSATLAALHKQGAQLYQSWVHTIIYLSWISLSQLLLFVSNQKGMKLSRRGPDVGWLDALLLGDWLSAKKSTPTGQLLLLMSSRCLVTCPAKEPGQNVVIVLICCVASTYKQTIHFQFKGLLTVVVCWETRFQTTVTNLIIPNRLSKARPDTL